MRSLPEIAKELAEVIQPMLEDKNLIHKLSKEAALIYANTKVAILLAAKEDFKNAKDFEIFEENHALYRRFMTQFKDDLASLMLERERNRLMLQEALIRLVDKEL